MEFSTMVLSMYVDADDDASSDQRILGAAVGQSLLAGELGFHPWYTEHHFRGPWHSSPLQFAAYIAPQLPPGTRLGFGVLSVPYYHPVRLTEQMNLLDQLTRGHVLYGLGSGFPGIENSSVGVSDEYHGSGQATRDNIVVLERLWAYRTGDEPYEFDTGVYRGRVVKRITPAPYGGRRRPTIIRTARTTEAAVDAARRGWPAFLGSFGADLTEQAEAYQSTLLTADHPPEVIDECLRYSTVDWTGVVVAEDEEEISGLIEAARAERAALRAALPADARQIAAGGPKIISGTPGRISTQVQLLRDLGIEHLLVRFLGEWHGQTRWIAERSMRLFAEHVIPRFTGSPRQRRQLKGIPQ
jgi:alkanesulfonate monooxygenase SsuD/methylene tetrahydromethanopterin reductase-like flavin-dependent oxidoreductase (luciferase family)